MEKLKEQLPIQEYFNIPITNENSFKVDIKNIINNKIELEIGYAFKHDGYYFEDLPPEINNLIDGYMTDSVKINITIVIPDEYPYRAPLWIVTNIDRNRVKESITTNFIDKIMCHNKEYYSPATLISKTILQFISSVKSLNISKSTIGNI
jgi:hypothetical protein